MRSYETARGLFTVMAFFAWLAIAAGVALSFYGVSLSGSRFFRGGEFMVILIVAGGIFSIALGILALALSQIGRAGVDSAEYSQQMLQLSREHLEVSRQSLRHGEQLKAGFEALKATLAKEPTVSYAGPRPAVEQVAAPSPSPTPVAGYGQRPLEDHSGADAKSLPVPDAVLTLRAVDLSTDHVKNKAP
jgi:hypothetical protein